MGVLAFAAFLFLVLVSVPATAADPLARSSWLGVQLSPTPEGRRVDVVLPGASAESLGVQPGDLIPDSPESLAWFTPGAAPATNSPISLPVLRRGARITLRGTARARPFETYSGAEVRYGSVAFGGGLLRDILVMPRAIPGAPVVYLIQGVDCGSVDSPNPASIWRRIGQALIDAGIGYYRVEKPGVGDSRGGAGCQAIDYRQEVDAFRTAYRHLVRDLDVPADRIFLFGVSMGGLHAPQLAAEVAPRGVAVWGTVVRSWGDYWHDLDTYQGFLLSGLDPVAEYRKAERYRTMLQLFYYGGQSPAAIVSAHPEMADALRDTLGWDGAEILSGRHWRYFQQVPAVNLFEAWSKVNAPVLSLYGESDVIALSGFDQRLIADLVNHYRPGTARFQTIPETDHLMRKVGPREALREAAIRNQPLVADFNPAITDALVAWIRGVPAADPGNGPVKSHK